MPYPRVEPAPEIEMKKQRWKGHHTICETLREIYAMTDNEEIKQKLLQAMGYAKKMHEKLKQYKQAEEARNG